MGKNLLLLARRLNDEDWKAIAFAMRCKGHLTEYLHFQEAAIEGRPQLMYCYDVNVVLAALREAAPLYPAAHDTIRKLERKRRKGR